MMKKYKLPEPNFIPVLGINDKLRFRFDYVRGLIEIQDRGVKEIFDLSAIAEKAMMKTNEIITDSV